MWRGVSTVLLFVVAVPVGTIYRQNIETWATKSGLDRVLSGGSEMLSSNSWGVPLLFLFLVLIGSTVALWLQHFFQSRFPAKFKKDLRIVRGKSFRHERVIIDGARFIECTFDGVTLVYQGTAYYGFEGNKFLGPFSFLIESQAAEGGLSLAKLASSMNVPLKFGVDQLPTQIGSEEKKPQ